MEKTKEKLTIEERKEFIRKLKKCARIYKENLLGYRFLVVFNGNDYKEILFKKADFKHLTGISSNLNANSFYERCIGKNHEYIEPNDIYTTNIHPKHLANKKLDIFNQLIELFSKPSYLLIDIQTNSKSFSIGIADLDLTLLFDKYQEHNSYYTASSLRAKSYVHLSNQHYPIDMILRKTNPCLKYKDLVFIRKDFTIDNKIHLIDYENMNIINIIRR